MPMERLSVVAEIGSEVPEQARCSTGRTSANFSTPPLRQIMLKKKFTVSYTATFGHAKGFDEAYM